MSDNSWSFRPPLVAYSMTIPYRINDTMMPKKENASHLQYTRPWSGVNCSASPLDAIAARAQWQLRRWRQRTAALSGARRHASAQVGRELLQWPRRRELGFSAPAPVICELAIRRSLLNRCCCVSCTLHPQRSQNRQLLAVTIFDSSVLRTLVNIRTRTPKPLIQGLARRISEFFLHSALCAAEEMPSGLEAKWLPDSTYSAAHKFDNDSQLVARMPHRHR